MKDLFKVDGSLMIWFDCPHCKAPSKDKVPMKSADLNTIPVTCAVCLEDLLINNIGER